MRPPFDPALNDLAKSFKNLDPFPDPDGVFTALMTGKSDFKRVCLRPGGNIIAARYYLSGRNRYVAYAPIRRETDLVRFADLMTVRLWKYSPRCRHRDVTDADLNFSVELCRQDLADFTAERPEVIHLMNNIERHLISIGVIEEGPIEVPRKRKTVRTEFLAMREAENKIAAAQHQELLDVIGALHDKLDEVTTRLSALEARPKLNPEWLTATHTIGTPDFQCINTDPQPQPASPNWVTPNIQ